MKTKTLVLTNDARDKRTDVQLQDDLVNFICQSKAQYFCSANGSTAVRLFKLIAVSQAKYPITAFSIIGHDNK